MKIESNQLVFKRHHNFSGMLSAPIYHATSKSIGRAMGLHRESSDAMSLFVVLLQFLATKKDVTLEYPLDASDVYANLLVATDSIDNPELRRYYKRELNRFPILEHPEHFQLLFEKEVGEYFAAGAERHDGEVIVA